jgi:ubiquinone/menaquinone biosynthesis C-methylase UbiE
MSDAGQLFPDGKAYERMMGRWSRVVGETFLDWLALPANLRVLDVGCGNGAFTEVLIARCSPAEVTAIDPSEGQLSYARTRPGTRLAQFRLGDAQALPFPDRNFDAATMALVITFVSDPAKAVAEMARVVRPGGLVATYMWDIAGGGIPVAPVQAAMESIGFAAPSRPGAAASKRDVMQSLWENAGLQTIETRVIRIPVAFANFDDFWDSNTVPVGPGGQAISALSASDKERLKSRLRQQLPIGADGRIAYEGVANAVKGRVPG